MRQLTLLFCFKNPCPQGACAEVNATLNTTLSTTLNTAEMTYNQTKLDICPFSSKFSRCVEEMQVLTRLWQSTLSSLDVVSVEASFAASEPRLTKRFADRANARNRYRTAQVFLETRAGKARAKSQSASILVKIKPVWQRCRFLLDFGSLHCSVQSSVQ